jgi:hypothetical protein
MDKKSWLALIGLLIAFNILKKTFDGNTQHYLLVGMGLVYFGMSLWYSKIKRNIKEELSEDVSDEDLIEESGEELAEELSDNPTLRREKRHRNIFDILIGIPVIVTPNIVHFIISDIEFTMDAPFTGINLLLLFVGFVFYLGARKLIIGSFKD